MIHCIKESICRREGAAEGDKKAENKNKAGVRRARGAVPRTPMWVFSFQHGGLKGKPCRDTSRVYQMSAHAGGRGSDVGLSIPSSRQRRRRHRSTSGLGRRVNLHGGRSDVSTKKGATDGQEACFDPEGDRDARRGAEPVSRKCVCDCVGRRRGAIVARDPVDFMLHTHQSRTRDLISGAFTVPLTR